MNILNSLENMGYRVVTSGAFAGGQGVFDRFQTPCNDANIRVCNLSNVLIIIMLTSVLPF